MSGKNEQISKKEIKENSILNLQKGKEVLVIVEKTKETIMKKINKITDIRIGMMRGMTAETDRITSEIKTTEIKKSTKVAE